MRHLIKFSEILTARERLSAITLFFALLLGAALEAVGVGLILPFITLIADPEAISRQPTLAWMYRTSGVTSTGTFLAGFGSLLIALYVGKNLFLGLLAYGQYRFFYGVQARLSARLLAFYLSRPYSFHLRRNSAVLLRNVNHEVILAFGFVVIPLATAMIETMITAALLALMLWVHPVPTLLAVGGLGGVAGLFYWLVRPELLRSGNRARDNTALMIQCVNQGLGGIKETKVLGREAFFVEEFRKRSIDFARSMRFYRVVSDAPRLFIEMLAVTGMLSIALVALTRGSAYGDLLSMLTLFGLVSIRLMPAMNRIVTSITSVRSNIGSFETVYEDLRALADDSEAIQGGAPSPTSPFQHVLELKAVGFTYDGSDRPAIHGVDMTIRRGQTVAIVGTSGAGKTTLVDLILGLLQPTSGEILVDGVALRSILLPWQRSIGYVPQSIFLSDDSIRRNVAFGLPEEGIDDSRVKAALRAASLDEFVESLPDKGETQVGERGVRLSGGQRQRIGIARALYAEPSVLVMDEATSSLDHETENVIRRSVSAFAGGKTVIIIAHRLTTVQECDVLFMIQEGRAVQAASYEELLASNAEFRRMVQSGLLKTGSGPG